MKTCGCGKTAFYQATGLCRSCRQRQYRAERKATGGPARSPECQDHFDWQAVERALAGERVGRKLTYAERLYLVKVATARPGWSPKSLGRLLGMSGKDGSGKDTQPLAEGVLSGRLRVPERDWQGRPVVPLTTHA